MPSRIVDRITQRPDRWALLLLVVLWVFFFWRLFPPRAVDAVSLQLGDFSGQFVAWTHYSVERLGAGELPLWNPYMHAGAPFLADPQTAVLYPPRLLTVLLLSWTSGDPSGGQIYSALQAEMALHVLWGLLGMYFFVRRLTGDRPRSASVMAGLVGAMVFGFGGFLSSYPPLQLPILETAVWGPWLLLALHQATPRQEAIRWPWLVGAGGVLALALLAGHPQTLLLTGYLGLAYLVYRLWAGSHPWRRMALAILVLGLVAGGLSAAQWLPTADFQAQTYRDDLSFADKGGGFNFQDVLQFLFPSLLGPWTPLYLGLLGVLLAALAAWRQVPQARFWLGVFGVALVLSFGQKLIGYSLVYLLLPGFSFFRGQERAAYLVALSGSVLAGLGTCYLLTWDTLTDYKAARQFQRGALGVVLFCGLIAGLFFFRRFQPEGARYQPELNAALYGLLVSGLAYGAIRQTLKAQASFWTPLLLVGLLAFDLFSANMAAPGVYDPVPAWERLPRPAYIQVMRQHTDIQTGQRVEGLVGLPQSYASLYSLPDIWGNSPLRLDVMEFYLWQMPFEHRWELLAVQVVNAEAETLPVPHTQVGSGVDFISNAAFNIFRLDEPRPFAHMVFQATVVPDQGRAQDMLRTPGYPLHDSVILEQTVPDLPQTAGQAQVEVAQFEPEQRMLRVQNDAPGVLTLALPFDGNWQVTVDGERGELLRAYGGLSAVYLPAGTHRVELDYRPWAFSVGVAVSGLTILALGLAGLVYSWRRTRRGGATTSEATE